MKITYTVWGRCKGGKEWANLATFDDLGTAADWLHYTCKLPLKMLTVSMRRGAPVKQRRSA